MSRARRRAKAITSCELKMTSDPLVCLENEFQLPADLHDLNCAYMSPQHRCVAMAGMAGLLRKNDPTTLGVEDFFGESDRVRTLFANLVRTPDPARIAIQPSVSYAMSIAARHLLRDAARSGATNVVLTAEQFPSNVHVWRKHADRLGLQVRAAATRVPPSWRFHTFTGRMVRASTSSGSERGCGRSAPPSSSMERSQSARCPSTRPWSSQTCSWQRDTSGSWAPIPPRSRSSAPLRRRRAARGDVARPKW